MSRVARAVMMEFRRSLMSIQSYEREEGSLRLCCRNAERFVNVTVLVSLSRHIYTMIEPTEERLLHVSRKNRSREDDDVP